MSDRIHDWLDGELTLEELTADERREALRLEEGVRMAADAARVSSPGLADRVMTALPPGPPRGSRSLAGWLANLLPGLPAVRRPAAAFAALGLLVGFGLGLASASLVVGPEPAAMTAEPTTAAAPTVYVRFDVRVAGAENVQLAGSFSDWEPRYALTPSEDDHWTVTIPLAPGVHDYIFVVDGTRQVLDPAAPRIADGFGSYNNRIALLTSST